MALIDEYVSDNYIQHSPTVKDGKAGLLEMIEFLKKIPRTGEPRSPIVRTIADGDLVAVHLDVAFMGKRIAVVDIFRVEDGKLAEHWDAAQEYPANMETGITVTNGAAVIEYIQATEANKKLVKTFCTELFENRNVPAALNFLSPNYIEHILEALLNKETGVDFLTARLQWSAIKVHWVLGEGNFTVVQSEGIKEGCVFVFYDIFRIESNTIAEHWCVEQKIPAAMAHSNGMI